MHLFRRCDGLVVHRTLHIGRRWWVIGALHGLNPRHEERRKKADTRGSQRWKKDGEDGGSDERQQREGMA